MNKILVILFMSLAVSQCGIPFIYTEADPHDPQNVAKVREALMHVGVSADGIKVISFLEKYEVIRNSYKATYRNRLGQECFIKWRVVEITGMQTPHMPVCENVAIGDGPDPLRVRYLPAQPVIYPQPVYQPAIYQPPRVVQPPMNGPVCPKCG